jgi:hypothetical protein
MTTWALAKRLLPDTGHGDIRARPCLDVLCGHGAAALCECDAQLFQLALRRLHRRGRALGGLHRGRRRGTLLRSRRAHALDTAALVANRFLQRAQLARRCCERMRVLEQRGAVGVERRRLRAYLCPLPARPRPFSPQQPVSCTLLQAPCSRKHQKHSGDVGTHNAMASRSACSCPAAASRSARPAEAAESAAVALPSQSAAFAADAAASRRARLTSAHAAPRSSPRRRRSAAISPTKRSRSLSRASRAACS